MAAGQRLSGKYGAINGQSTVRNWNATITNTPYVYGASNTRAGKARTTGVFDWTGSFTQMLAVPTVMPGDVFTFDGFLAPNTGVWGTAGPTKTGDAIVENIVITWNWETNEPIMSVVNFAGVTPLTDATDTITDVTLTDLSVPQGLHMMYGVEADAAADIFAGTVGDNLLNLSKAVLTLTCTNNRFVDSETDGWASRVRGTFDWTLDITQNEVALADRPFDVNDILTLVLPINDTEYWTFKWGRVINFSGVTVDMTTGTILTQTINMGMQAHTPTTVIGAIRAPGALADWWPWTT